ncbi:hypothetical protein MUO83_07855 [Candidatus Bathyarchaeota archaeon]|nr:hypothetical protein [Candidatus Bathyarchaeota archaeon]
MTLISSIGDCVGAVTWTTASHDTNVLYTGLSLGKFGVADIVTDALFYNGAANYALATLSEAAGWALGLTSAGLTVQVKATIDGLTWFAAKHLPMNYTGTDFGHFYETTPLFYFANRVRHDLAETDCHFAWQEWKAICTAAGHGIYYGNPITLAYSSSNRFYDENACSIDVLLMLYRGDMDGNLGALTYARDTLWPYLNATHWSVDHYNYRPDWTGYECSGASFAMIIGQLRAVNGYDLTNWANVLTDIHNRFFVSGWDSPNWTFGATRYYCTIHHHTDTNERRLGETFSAWVALHAFHQVLPAADQTAFVALLDGATKAWEYLLSTSTLYDGATKTFRYLSGIALSEGATAMGIHIMFLLGIVPQTGSLYVPLMHTSYEAWHILNEYFMFDYTKRRIRIPVKAGTIKFIYGTTPTTVTFPEDGVYELLFSADWNMADKAEKIRDLDFNLYYVADPAAPAAYSHTRASMDNGINKLGEDVTRRALTLSVYRDPITGWFLEDWVNTTIKMAVVPKSAQGLALQMGYYVSIDAIGATMAMVVVGDQIVNGAGVHYEVKTVLPYYLQGQFVTRICDLKELPLNG